MLLSGCSCTPAPSTLNRVAFESTRSSISALLFLNVASNAPHDFCAGTCPDLICQGRSRCIVNDHSLILLCSSLHIFLSSFVNWISSTNFAYSWSPPTWNQLFTKRGGWRWVHAPLWLKDYNGILLQLLIIFWMDVVPCPRSRFEYKSLLRQAIFSVLAAFSQDRLLSNSPAWDL